MKRVRRSTNHYFYISAPVSTQQFLQASTKAKKMPLKAEFKISKALHENLSTFNFACRHAIRSLPQFRNLSKKFAV